MCILCAPERAEEVKQVTHLFISWCPDVKEVPFLPKLRQLYCYGCTSLEVIPSLPNLWTLDCSHCPRLFSLPVFPKLERIDCSTCPLTTQPIALGVASRDCPWLEPLLSTNLPSVLRIQRWVRNLKARRFARLTSSRAFNEYFFAPHNQGGQWHKRSMARDYAIRL